MKTVTHSLRWRLSLLALAAALSACSSIDLFSSDKIDYRSTAVKARPLDIPPDLTQLARDPRYAPQGGVVSAAAVAAAPNSAQATQVSTVAAVAAGKARVERLGAHRWLVVDGATPEVLWPEIRTFWQDRGFTLTTENAQAGIMETDWAENRAKLPTDVVRSTLGRLVDRLYDTGERDRFRTRVERTPTGTEIYITHRGLEEVYTTERKEATVWVPRSNDAQLESEMLARLMVKLGTKEETARSQIASAPEVPARARAVTNAARAELEVDEPFDRAWRRVGLALDRSGFTVEDRDRSAGLYFVRYVDPKLAGREEPGFFARLFGASNADRAPVRYRVQVKAAGDKSLVTVLNASGAAETGDSGKSIVASLVRELR